MNEREALKLALDALENHTAIKHPQQIHYRDKAITAAIKALAQPEQEPVAYTGNGTAGREADVKPTGFFFQMPPQRTWVGLTDEDKQNAFDDTQEGGGFWEFADAIEAKLKEKNT